MRGVRQREQAELFHADDLDLEIVDKLKLTLPEASSLPQAATGPWRARAGPALLAAGPPRCTAGRPPRPRIRVAGAAPRVRLRRPARRRMSSHATGRIPPPNVPGKRARSEVSGLRPLRTRPLRTHKRPVIISQPRQGPSGPVIPPPAHLRRPRSAEKPLAETSPLAEQGREEPP